MKKSGFTLIELLIVIAIIGILAAVLVPNLLRSRQVANDRAALSYAQNVYKAAQAHLAENTNATTVATNCTGGYSPASGSPYTVPNPGSFITQCDITSDATRVTVTYTGGTTNTQQVGQ